MILRQQEPNVTGYFFQNCKHEIHQNHLLNELKVNNRGYITLFLASHVDFTVRLK